MHFHRQIAGSSPRMRGKPPPPYCYDTCLRIIPAHAGQTRHSTGWPCRRPDHPRACGANAYGVLSEQQEIGSSPRMRGKRSPSCLAASRPDSPDHPRACGANLGKIGSLFGSFGSSPRMRGKRRRAPCRWLAFRIIPAHAGQTLLISLSAVLWPDHPRACGANSPILCENS